MRVLAVLAGTVLVLPLATYGAAASPADRARPDEQVTVVDVAGRWQLNADLSDHPRQPGSEAEPGERRGPEGHGRRPGEGGGFPGGMGGGMGGMGGGGMRGGPAAPPPSPEEMVRRALAPLLKELG